MSRSFKNNPVNTDKNNKLEKRRANKKIRRLNNLIKGSIYKKHFCSWNICDYKWYLSRENAIIYWKGNVHNIQKRYKTLEEYLDMWHKHYYYK